MRVVASHLGQLEGTCLRRFRVFRGEIEHCPTPLTREGDRLVAFIAIEMLNLWASFVRAYYLSCCMRGKRVGGGRVLIPAAAGIGSCAQAIDFAMQTVKPYQQGGPPWSRREEPAWHDAQTLLKLSLAAGVSNASQVQAAFGVRTRVFLDLPVFRNFFAHRNDDTARKVSARARYYGLSPQLRPSEILCAASLGRPQRVCSDWLDDLCDVVQSLCQ
jgi:hypothetical protein